MPELEINLDALAHNLRLVRHREQAWGFRFLPVLKMVASHPEIVSFLRRQGYGCQGIADMTEHLLYGQEPPARAGRVLINLAPPDRTDDVVRLFERSSFSCEATFRALDAAARAGDLLGHALHRVSLGGTIFWNWFARRHGHGPHLPPGCIMEFRMGDPLLLGWDMYRDQALLGGDFRQDIFRLTATVLEVTERDIRPPRQSVHNGRGLPADCPVLGKRLRALVDCGSLHTDVQGLTLPRTDWRITDFSGNYAVLDVSACPQAPVTGDHVRFIPSYWAVARTCRMPHIRKTIVHDILPERSLPGTRPVAPHQGTTFLSEVS